MLSRIPRHVRPVPCLLLPLLLLTLLASVACGAPEVSGRVVCGEQPLRGVLVSDGRQVVTTDAEGRYALPLPDDGALVRVSLPSGYWPEGKRWFERVPGGAAGTCDFALTLQEQPSPWRIVQFTDSHFITPAAERLRQFCEEVNGLEPPVAFVMATGDLVMDSNPVSDPAIVRRIYAEYQQATAPLQPLLFNLPGNHDHPGVTAKLSLDDPVFGTPGYEALVGPAWYSLNYGGVHVIALDATVVDGPARKLWGGFTPECLAWLRADLAATPRTTPLLVFTHQNPADWRNAAELRELLAGREVLGIFCGHTHRSREYDWEGFRVYEGGALSGAWWTGPCPDGKPRGFRTITVTPEGVTTEYVAAASPPAVSGQVYEERDGKPGFAAGEVALVGVVVSDGRQVARTDAQGRYSLALAPGGALVRLSIPTGYWPVANRWFERVPGGAAVVCDFPLEARSETSPWRLLHFTDVHYVATADPCLAAFRAQVSALQPPPALAMATGDLVTDSAAVSDPAKVRALFSGYLQALSPLSVPLLNLPGNHDHPGAVPGHLPPEDPLHGTRGFEALVGPAWYSLNYAGVHLIALDSTRGTVTAGKLDGGFAAEQLDWLRKDLAEMPPEAPILVFVHHHPAEWTNGAELKGVLGERKVLGIFCGHTHGRRAYQWQGYPVYEGGTLRGATWTTPGPDRTGGFQAVTVMPEAVTVEWVQGANPG